MTDAATLGQEFHQHQAAHRPPLTFTRTEEALLYLLDRHAERLAELETRLAAGKSA